VRLVGERARGNPFSAIQVAASLQSGREPVPQLARSLSRQLLATLSADVVEAPNGPLPRDWSRADNEQHHDVRRGQRPQAFPHDIQWPGELGSAAFPSAARSIAFGRGAHFCRCHLGANGVSHWPAASKSFRGR
jgi:hypothetical protein